MIFPGQRETVATSPGTTKDSSGRGTHPISTTVGKRHLFPIQGQRRSSLVSGAVFQPFLVINPLLTSSYYPYQNQSLAASTQYCAPSGKRARAASANRKIANWCGK